MPGIPVLVAAAVAVVFGLTNWFGGPEERVEAVSGGAP
jgi:hypothetical protein